MEIDQIVVGQKYAYTRNRWGSIEPGYEIVEALGIEPEQIHQNGRDVLVDRVRVRFADGSEKLSNPRWVFGTVEEAEATITRHQTERRQRELDWAIESAQREQQWYEATAPERERNAQARLLAARLRVHGFALDDSELPDFVVDRQRREQAEEDYETTYYPQLHTTFTLSVDRMQQLIEALDGQEASANGDTAAS